MAYLSSSKSVITLLVSDWQNGLVNMPLLCCVEETSNVMI